MKGNERKKELNQMCEWIVNLDLVRKKNEQKVRD